MPLLYVDLAIGRADQVVIAIAAHEVPLGAKIVIQAGDAEVAHSEVRAMLPVKCQHCHSHVNVATAETGQLGSLGSGIVRHICCTWD